MQALTLSARRLVAAVPQMHALRARVLLAPIQALMQHPRLSITALGRSLVGDAKPKHRTRRIDRLIGNPHLAHERQPLYGMVCRWLLTGIARPAIVVDWSDATVDRQWQLLRAALPTQGRTLTLYEEVHPLQHLSNRQVQTAFLHQLRALLPSGCRPIIVTDAGFSTPWFRVVEQLGWSWLSRLRGQEYIRWAGESAWWQGRLLYVLALTKPRALGEVEIVRANPCTRRSFCCASQGKDAASAPATAPRRRANTARRTRAVSASPGCWPPRPICATGRPSASSASTGGGCRSRLCSLLRIGPTHLADPQEEQIEDRPLFGLRRPILPLKPPLHGTPGAARQPLLLAKGCLASTYRCHHPGFLNACVGP